MPMSKIAYSIRSAGKAFHPPLSEKLIRRMVRAGCFKTVEIGGSHGVLRGYGEFRDRGLDVRFSNRPFEVKHFQTIHHCSVDVARGLALLFGIGTKALPLWDSRTRRNNLGSAFGSALPLH